MEKDKKKTLTISSNLKKKIDTTSISATGKKSFSIDNDNLSKRQFCRFSNDSSNHILNDREFTSDNFYNIIN